MVKIINGKSKIWINLKSNTILFKLNSSFSNLNSPIVDGKKKYCIKNCLMSISFKNISITNIIKQVSVPAKIGFIHFDFLFVKV